VPVNVTLSVFAGGKHFHWDIEVGGREFEPFHLPLTDFKGGNVNITLITPEGWETDLEDNTWTGDAELQTPFIYWIAGGAAIVIAVAAVVMLAKRKR